MNARPRVLDLYCGEGGAATGYERAGFEVVGVDIAPQPLYPFPFIQADALEYVGALTWLELQQYAAIHASPPCQRFMRGHVRDRESRPDLIAPTRAALRETGLPYIIENLIGAPLEDRVMICGGGLGYALDGWQLHRHRYFEASFPIMGVPCSRQAARTMTVAGNGTGSCGRVRGESDYSMAQRRAMMEMPWGTREGISQAIPPRYTEHIGAALQLELAGSVLEV